MSIRKKRPKGKGRVRAYPVGILDQHGRCRFVLSVPAADAATAIEVVMRHPKLQPMPNGFKLISRDEWVGLGFEEFTRRLFRLQRAQGVASLPIYGAVEVKS